MDPVAKCVCLVAYLEGRHRLPLPENAHDLAVPNIQKRIVALERAVGIASPPPFDISSWNGLAWRVWQVRYKTGRTFMAYSEDLEQLAAMADDGYTLFSLRCVVDGLDPNLPVLQCPGCASSEAGVGSSEACLAAMVQKLVYIAGSRQWYFAACPWTKALIYAYAADVSFAIAKNAPGWFPEGAMIRPPPRPLASLLPPEIKNTGAPKGHEKTRSTSRRSSPGKLRADFFGQKRKTWSTWVSKLLFWRSRRKVYSDSSSSSGSSMIIVD